MTFTGYVYKITGACNLVYIGSTVDMRTRKSAHKNRTKKINYCSSRLLLKPLQFEIIDTREYKLLRTLRLVEQFYLDNTNTINQRRAYTNYKSFNYKQKRKQYMRSISNSEKRRSRQTLWCVNNKDKISETNKKSYNKNREKRLEQAKVQIMCECGCLMRKDTKPKHIKSKKHLELMNLL